MGLIDDLGSGPVAFDTSVFIYFIEQHSDWYPLVAPIFAGIDAGRCRAVTSSVTLLEVLVVPLRAGNGVLASRYESLLTRSKGLSMVELDREVIKVAAQLRAKFAVRTPDALQLAAGLSASATAFVTNDRVLPSLPGMPVVQLGSYASSHSKR